MKLYNIYSNRRITGNIELGPKIIKQIYFWPFGFEPICDRLALFAGRPKLNSESENGEVKVGATKGYWSAIGKKKTSSNVKRYNHLRV